MTARLLIVTFSIVLAGFILESTRHIRADYTFRKETLVTRANLLADLHAIALADPLWNFERETMESAMAGLAGVADVLGARVTHPNGEVILGVGNFPLSDDGVVTVRRQIESTNAGNARLIGYFEIALSSFQVDAALKEAIFTAVIIILLLIGVIMTAVFVALRHITQPLDTLNQLMRRFAEGHLDLDIPHLDRDDEIGRVASAVRMFRDNAVELEKLRDGLEQRVRDQTRDLRLAKEDAESANQVKSDFLSSMSHELRTPLNAIMGFAQLLELDIKKHPDNPRFGDSVRQILASSHQLLELIDQVLDLAKIETGQQDVNLEDTPIGATLRAAEEALQSLAAKFKVRVERSAAPCWNGKVRADPDLLRQAIHHLLSNAIKYNRPGGRVELQCTCSAQGRCRLSITDTGRGIPQEKRGDLFQPFARLGAEASVIEGTGIGLVITKKLVEAMGGEIGFESVVGTGSTFWIELPISSGQGQDLDPAERPLEAPTKAPEDGVEPTIAPVHTGRVLYVEDTPANVSLMVQYFSVIPGGPELVTATTGEEGVEMALKLKPDMILMDINLPGISGLEAMLQLRQRPQCAHTPIVAISADAMPDEIQKARDAGFDDYLTKPIQLKMLKTLIERHVGAFEG